MGPFEILDRIGAVAYRVALPPTLATVHNVFHVSMLRKYVADPSHVLSTDQISVPVNLKFEEKPVKILDTKEQYLRRRVIKYVKVQWSHHSKLEATWGIEEEIKCKYPYLFL